MKKIIWTLLPALLMSILPAKPALADLNRGKIKKGLKAWENRQWDQALSHFQDALLDDPANPLAHYNLAEAQYKKQRYEEALESYQKSLSTADPLLKEKAYYNMGNSYYQLNKYQESIDSYIKALELDPDDLEAKHNLE
ncbi:MAG: tetratricopeptide repeat protein, partial [Calditrichia bacterium]